MSNLAASRSAAACKRHRKASYAWRLPEGLELAAGSCLQDGYVKSERYPLSSSRASVRTVIGANHGQDEARQPYEGAAGRGMGRGCGSEMAADFLRLAYVDV